MVNPSPPPPPPPPLPSLLPIITSRYRVIKFGGLVFSFSQFANVSNALKRFFPLGPKRQHVHQIFSSVSLREVHTEISQKILTFSGHLNERRFPNFICGRGSNTKNLFIMTHYLWPIPQLQRLGVWTGWSIATAFYDIAHTHFDILMCGYFSWQLSPMEGRFSKWF